MALLSELYVPGASEAPRIKKFAKSFKTESVSEGTPAFVPVDSFGSGPEHEQRGSSAARSQTALLHFNCSGEMKNDAFIPADILNHPSRPRL